MADGIIREKIVPYTRGVMRVSLGKGKGSKSVKTKQGVRYDESQTVLSRHLFVSWIERYHPSPETAMSRLMLAEMAPGNAFERLLGDRYLIDEPCRFGLAIGAPPVKSGPRRGELPVSEGDYDNFVKAFLDAAQKCRLVPDDSLHWYRGPCRPRDDLRAGVYFADEWIFVWRFECVEDDVQWLRI